MSLELKNPTLMREAALVGGRWINADGAGVEVTNPATGAVLGHVPKLGTTETLDAIAAAEVAQKGWAARTAKDRSYVLRQLVRPGDRRTPDDLALHPDRGTGQAGGRGRGRDRLRCVVRGVVWRRGPAASYGDITFRATQRRQADHRRSSSPSGWWPSITPWNFPNAMITRKAGPAWRRAVRWWRNLRRRRRFRPSRWRFWPSAPDCRQGVFSVVTDRPGRDWQGILRKPRRAQADLYRIHRSRPHPDAQSDRDQETAAWNWAATPRSSCLTMPIWTPPLTARCCAKFRNNGQTCVCANRIYVQAGVYDAFAEKLAAAGGQACAPATGCADGMCLPAR